MARAFVEPLATNTTPGLMSAADKGKLDTITPGGGGGGGGLSETVVVNLPQNTVLTVTTTTVTTVTDFDIYDATGQLMTGSIEARLVGGVLSICASEGILISVYIEGT